MTFLKPEFLVRNIEICFDMSQAQSSSYKDVCYCNGREKSIARYPFAREFFEIAAPPCRVAF
jgi:hypothetical protein